MRNPKLRRPTCYRLYCARLPASREKHDIPLRGFHIATFENEDFLNTVLLERTELDEKSNGSKQVLLYHQILLASYLQDVSDEILMRSLLTLSSSCNKSLLVLSVMSWELIAACGAITS